MLGSAMSETLNPAAMPSEGVPAAAAKSDAASASSPSTSRAAPETVEGYAAIVLAGGAGSRLGGIAKPAVAIGGVPMIERVLAAVRASGRVVVVGPAALVVATHARTVQESPPGGGPVAAVGAAFDALDGELADVVAIVAADLPLLTADAIRQLVETVEHGRVDGATYIDGDGHRQWLCGAWRTAAVAERLAVIGELRGGDLAGAALRDLFGPLAVAEVRHDGDPPPWFDCDTDDDIRRVEEWLTR
jgi:molybdopterin-guanine dinucleotide biosynthesis protein A